MTEKSRTNDQELAGLSPVPLQVSGEQQSDKVAESSVYTMGSNTHRPHEVITYLHLISDKMEAHGV